MKVRPSPVPLLALLTLLVACSPTELDPSAEVTLFGSVTLEDGGSAAALEVRATAYIDECGGASIFTNGRDATVGDAGAYEVRLVGMGAPFDGCVVLEVYDGDAPTVPLHARTLERVWFRREGGRVRADLLVPAPLTPSPAPRPDRSESPPVRERSRAGRGPGTGPRRRRVRRRAGEVVRASRRCLPR